MAFFSFYSIPATLLIAFFFPWFVQSVTLQSDIEALRSLKQAVDANTIPPSSFLDTWNFQVDPCESTGANFLGILCTIPVNNVSRVSLINLDASGYDGFLPSAMGNLTELTTLQLNRNNFRRPIPATISNLQKLTTLSLSENFFTGTLPPGLNRLQRLEVMDLSNNQLSGSLPQYVSQFRSLNVLRLSSNQFTGRIPDLTALWQLNTLDLSNNYLHGALPQLPTNLRTLKLSYNTLSGHISSRLRRMENLETLDLRDNNFSGSISREILTLTNLNHIDVSTNNFSNIEVERNSGKDTALQVLDVHGNRLRGHLPVNLVTYANLTTIDLGNNRFSGEIPVEYGEKLGGEWRSLFLDHNFLVGRLPPHFTNSASNLIRGSLAQNCLNCPRNVHWCRGGQRPASECPAQNGSHHG